ncbi:hypothetical protein [Treponema pectinovorum]|uniref:hypothetical protein n=1 Tax=Treponema pectinovorum TaxID=164 RepID=UPI0011CA8AB8|nr:hypothetical protein [Treponema pectinovorum]
MKKFFALTATFVCLLGLAFADEVGDLLKDPVGNETVTIVPEDQHVTNKTAKVQLEYTPLTDEVRLYYTCHAVAFDQGEAMNTALAVLKDFQEQNNYFSYKYMKRDSVKYYKDEKTGFKWAMYQSFVRFQR